MPSQQQVSVDLQLYADSVDLYAEQLSKIARECERSGVSFSGKVMRDLSDILGPSPAQAVVFYVHGENLSNPKRLVEGIVRLFHQGAPVILAKLVEQTA